MQRLNTGQNHPHNVPYDPKPTMTESLHRHTLVFLTWRVKMEETGLWSLTVNSM